MLEELLLSLGTVLQKQLLDFNNPLVMHVPLIDQIILLYNVSVWRVRNPIRNIEKVSTFAMLLRRNS
jgi:hypothetical protein